MEKRQETITIVLSQADVARLRIYAERRKAYDGTERSLEFWAEEVANKGVNALLSGLESSITLRNQRNFHKEIGALGACPAIPADFGSQNPAQQAAILQAVAQWQGRENALRRKYGVGGSQAEA